jgi:hypothetical protein
LIDLLGELWEKEEVIVTVRSKFGMSLVMKIDILRSSMKAFKHTPKDLI